MRVRSLIVYGSLIVYMITHSLHVAFVKIYQIVQTIIAQIAFREAGDCLEAPVSDEGWATRQLVHFASTFTFGRGYEMIDRHESRFGGS